MHDLVGPLITADVAGAPHTRFVEAAGELDMDGAPVLRRALRAALAVRGRQEVVVVDLARVAFCDSAGLDALLRARAEAGRRGVLLVLARPGAAVARMLEITGTDRVLHVLSGWRPGRTAVRPVPARERTGCGHCGPRPS
ncbi:STAS domain-containing protein [Kitasatospora sp. NPDC088160]|uniref:STAS domain-containing protein n=1 Tax=Kitasatospora sp. NPDC088160 TaxID=3364072 RepID=UPI0037F7FE5F